MATINPAINSATAFAPATCANVAVGFDILGFAVEQLGDTVSLTRRSDNTISIATIDSNETLPLDPDKNTASVVIKKLCHDLNLTLGFSIHIKKGIPLSSGLGGSAASAVAALVACNAFLEPKLSLPQLAHYALFGEVISSGQQHADNIVPCIWGGLTLIRGLNPIEVIQLPVPKLFCVLIHPHLQVSTQQARKILKAELPLKDYIKQSANLATFISALYQNNLELLQHCLTDILIEPQRAQFVPGFYEIKTAALKAGALGVSFSGSGPTLFAFARSIPDANAIAVAMQTQLKNNAIDSDYWISPISTNASHITQIG